MRIACVGLVLLAACASPKDAPLSMGVPQEVGSPNPHVRNVIFLIGDGMGFSQVTLARIVGGTPLTLDACSATGFQITCSADQCVTDSAAAATALASGTKTNNFSIGIDPTGKPLETLLEQARARGKATGLVTTSKITHATPASFAAHVSHRSKEGDIAKQYLDAGVDVMLGGGECYFDADLLAAFESKGYTLVRDKTSLARCTGTHVLGLFHRDHVPYVLDRGPECPSLIDMTRAALGSLSQDPDGFFLMVEGARIDMACHASDAASSMREMQEFDDTIRVALEFAKKDGQTLVVVTADHATGALAITEKIHDRIPRFARVKTSAESLDQKMKQDSSGSSRMELARAALKQWADVDDATDEEISTYWATKGAYDPAARLGELISKRLGVTFIPLDYRLKEPNATHGHDGAMVPIYADGPGADRFVGTLDNTEIPKRIRELAGYR